MPEGAAASDLPSCVGSGCFLDPVEETAGKVDACDRAVGVAGEVAALSLEASFGDDVLVAVAGKEADGRGRVVRGHFLVRCLADLRLDPDRQGETGAVGVDVEVYGVDLVAADDLLGLFLVVWERLHRLLDDAEVVLECPP